VVFKKNPSNPASLWDIQVHGIFYYLDGYFASLATFVRRGFVETVYKFECPIPEA
jgi:hypothetical protein